ncbi:MAG: FliM/FliN family flagellar motor C-terminal domain-containing protein [Janthinobacterium lividum]
MQESHLAGDLPVDPLAVAYSMPMRLVLETAVVDFTVRTLMMLEPGSIVETAAQQNEDLMLHVNGQAVGMVKFDVSGDNLAVRLTGVA